jgi:arginine deiminase
MLEDKYHPRFKDADVPVWLDRNSPFNIEGGDELILSKDSVNCHTSTY